MTEPPGRRRLHLFRGGYLVLLVSILVLYVLQPIVEHRGPARAVLLLLLLGVIVPGVLAASRHLVVLVARLVGIHITQTRGEEGGK